ncbi:MAG: hypothetical protein ABJB76_12045 [Candidatus Nitrosocosmicus sp.]
MGLLIKGSTEEICKFRFKGRERVLQKGVRKILSQIPEGFTIAAVHRMNQYLYMMYSSEENYGFQKELDR